MASLIKKPGSRFWFACYRDSNGKQHRQSTSETDRKKAFELARHYEEMAQGKLRPHKARQVTLALLNKLYGESAPTATVRQYIENWLSGKERTARATYLSYQKSTAKFLDFLGHSAERDIAEITKTHISGFCNSRVKQVAPGTVNLDLSIVRMVFKAASHDGYIDKSPAESVKGVRREDQDVRRPFRVDEIKALLSIADPEWRSLIKFGLYTGQRLADVASLTWANIDTERNQIRFVTRKTNKTMLLPIAAPLRNHLAALPGSDNPKAPLHPRSFATIHRERGRVGSLSHQFADLLIQVGLRKDSERIAGERNSRRTKNELSFHCLRHTAATLLKDAGIPEAVVMEMIGHDSKQMSGIYTHVGQEALQKAAAALPVV
jgi:integrase